MQRYKHPQSIDFRAKIPISFLAFVCAKRTDFLLLLLCSWTFLNLYRIYLEYSHERLEEYILTNSMEIWPFFVP